MPDPPALTSAPLSFHAGKTKFESILYQGRHCKSNFPWATSCDDKVSRYFRLFNFRVLTPLSRHITLWMHLLLRSPCSIRRPNAIGHMELKNSQQPPPRISSYVWHLIRQLRTALILSNPVDFSPVKTFLTRIRHS